MAEVLKYLQTNRGFGLTLTGAATITASTTVTNLFTPIVIPAGKMGNNKILDFIFVLHLTTPALTIPSLTLTLKLGTATYLLSNNGALSASIADKPIIIEGSIANDNATNKQFLSVKMFNNSGGLILSGLASAVSVTDGTWTVDTTVDQALVLTAVFGGLSGTTSITAKQVRVALT